MLLDNHAVFSEKQPLTASAASTHTVDQGAAGDARTGLYAVVHIAETFAGATQLTATLQTCDRADFSGGVKTLAEVSAPAADLKKNAVLMKLAMPAGTLRYLRMNYTVAGTATAGQVSAFLTDMVDL